METNECLKFETYGTWIKYGAFALIVLVILVTLFNYLGYKKGNINRNSFYAKLIIKLIISIIVFTLLIFADKKVIPSYVENCQKENDETEAINKAKNDLQALKQSLLSEDYEKVQNEIKEIKNVDVKSTLQSELDSLESYVKLNSTITSLKTEYKLKDYYETYREIEKISNESYKNILLANINALGKGKPLDLTSGLKEGTSNSITFKEGIPLHPIENMPLVIVMQAYYCHDDFAVNSSKYTDEEFFYLAPNISAYDDNKLKKLKTVIDEMIEKYKIDKNRLYISGHSNGCLATYKMVDFFPNYFAAAVPISYHPNGFNASSYKNTAFWGICGTGETCVSTVTNFANKINQSGGNAKATSINGGHGDTQCTFLDKEVLEWVFAQVKK